METAQQVVGVRFQPNTRAFYFDPGPLSLHLNDLVVAEPYRGLEVGQVVLAPGRVLNLELTESLKPILRLATEEDLAQRDRRQEQAEQALLVALQIIQEMALPMRCVDTEYTLDGSRLTIFFTAPDRVDFRPLLRRLASRFATWVELRQVGERDAAKLHGGYGICGRPLCCSTFLLQLGGVSVRMLRTQGLPVTPEKYAGLCGLLRCCVAYENEEYEEARERLPHMGARILTPQGPAQVVNVMLLKETVLALLETGGLIEVAADALAAAKT